MYRTRISTVSARIDERTSASQPVLLSENGVVYIQAEGEWVVCVSRLDLLNVIAEKLPDSE